MVKRSSSTKNSTGVHQAAVELGKIGGKKGGPARAIALSPQRRSEIASEGGKARSRNKG